MKILGYQSQMGIQNASGGQSGGYQHPSAFMSAGQERLPHDLSNLSKGLSQLGGAMHQIGIERRQEVMELDLLKTVQDRSAEASAFMDDYMQNHQGRDAVDAERAFAEYSKKMVDEEMGRWHGNKRAQNYLQAQLGGMANRGVEAMRGYGNQELEKHRVATTNTQWKLTEQAWSDPAISDEEQHEKYVTWERMHVANNAKRGLPLEQTQLEVDTAYRSLTAAKLGRSFQHNLNNNNLAGAERDLIAMKGGGAASFTAQFESGGLGSRAIGYDKNGGTSYGTYQISSKQGTMDDFIAWAEKSGHGEVAQVLQQAGQSNTGGREGEFVEAWQGLVSAGRITQGMEQDFITESHVQPAFKALPADIQEAIQADPKLQQALFSTAVQHGANGAAKLFRQSWEVSHGDTGSFIDALYSIRKEQFGASDEDTQRAVAGRLEREKRLLGAAVVEPELIAKHEKMLETALVAERKRLVRNDFSIVTASLSDVPYTQWDEYVYSRIRQYPEENRKDIAALYESEKAVLKKARDGKDAGIIDRFVTELGKQHVSPAEMKEVVLEKTHELVENGLSLDGVDLLNNRIDTMDKETAQNIQATDVLRDLIDQEHIAEPDQVKVYGFQKGMTTKQIEACLNYLNEGGQEGALWKSRGEINKVLKYYNNDKGLESDPQFFETVRKAMDGKKVTPATLRETVRELLIAKTEGEIKGDGEAIFSLGYGSDMTYAEAKAQGREDTWLPDVSSEDKERIRSDMKILYGIQNLSTLDVRWIRRKELGLDVPKDKVFGGKK